MMNPDPMAQRKKAPSIALAVRFSNRPFGVKRFQTIHHHSVDVTSRARASLRNQHHGSSIMGFEDEMEQLKNGLAVRRYGRSKQTDELISSIVPRGASFPPLGGARGFSYRPWTALMPLRALESNGTRCRQPICGA
jgi:hypothetical protein